MLFHVPDGPVGDPFPQRFILVNTHYFRGKTLLIPGNQYVPLMLGKHALGGYRGRDDRLAVAHAQVDLALHAGAVTQRRNREAAVVEKIAQVLNEAMKDHAVRLEFAHFFRCLAADQMKCRIRDFRMNQRPDPVHKPGRGVDIGRMLIAPYEKQVLALGKACLAAVDGVNVRQDMDDLARRVAGEHLLLHGADHQGRVRRFDDGELGAPGLAGHTR